MKIGDLITQLKRPVLEKIRNYMVSYFCHKMKSFVYIGHNESFNNSEILSDKIHKSSMNIQKQSAVNKQNSNTISKISGQEPSVN